MSVSKKSQFDLSGRMKNIMLLAAKKELPMIFSTAKERNSFRTRILMARKALLEESPELVNDVSFEVKCYGSRELKLQPMLSEVLAAFSKEVREEIENLDLNPLDEIEAKKDFNDALANYRNGEVK